MKLTLLILAILIVAVAASDVKKAPIAVPAKVGDICVYHARTKRAGQPVVHERICDKASDGKCEWSVRMKGMLPVGDFLCLQKDEEEITEDAKPPKKQNPKKKFKKGGPIAVQNFLCFIFIVLIY